MHLYNKIKRYSERVAEFQRDMISLYARLSPSTLIVRNISFMCFCLNGYYSVSVALEREIVAKPRRLKWGNLRAEKAACESFYRIYKLRRADDSAGMDSLRRPRGCWPHNRCTDVRLCNAGCIQEVRGCWMQMKPVGL